MKHTEVLHTWRDERNGWRNESTNKVKIQYKYIYNICFDRFCFDRKLRDSHSLGAAKYSWREDSRYWVWQIKI